MNSYYIHPQAIVETSSIGKDSKIWAFTHILPKAVIGKNVVIADHCFIENDVLIGNSVTIKCGVFLWDGLRIEDDVFLGPGACFTNDKYPRSKNTNYKQEKTVLRKGCTIGANATVIAGMEIGRYALVGAGAVVTKNVPDFALVFGNPAIVHGYVCVCGNKLIFQDSKASCSCGREYVLDGLTVNIVKEKI